jgi:hypothetical protein
MSLIAHPTSGLLLVGSPAQGGTGLLAVSVNCCCDAASGGGPDCPECCCTEYVFTLSGVTGGTSCAADLDGTYTLPELLSCTLWQKVGGVAATLGTDPNDPASDCGVYRLSIGPTITDSASATYVLSAADWDCLGCNVMTLESFDGPCTWPATVEVCCND